MALCNIFRKAGVNTSTSIVAVPSTSTHIEKGEPFTEGFGNGLQITVSKIGVEVELGVEVAEAVGVAVKTWTVTVLLLTETEEAPPSNVTEAELERTEPSGAPLLTAVSKLKV